MGLRCSTDAAATVRGDAADAATARRQLGTVGQLASANGWGRSSGHVSTSTDEPDGAAPARKLRDELRKRHAIAATGPVVVCVAGETSVKKRTGRLS